MSSFLMRSHPASLRCVFNWLSRYVIKCTVQLDQWRDDVMIRNLRIYRWEEREMKTVTFFNWTSSRFFLKFWVVRFRITRISSPYMVMCVVILNLLLNFNYTLTYIEVLRGRLRPNMSLYRGGWHTIMMKLTAHSI